MYPVILHIQRLRIQYRVMLQATQVLNLRCRQFGVSETRLWVQVHPVPSDADTANLFLDGSA